MTNKTYKESIASIDYSITRNIEIAMVNLYKPSRYLVVPNVYWSFFIYELDLCCVNTNSFYGTEIEIKTSRSDLKRDQNKFHNHDTYKAQQLIRYLWFAMPVKLRNSIDLIPERAGIYFIEPNGNIIIERKPQVNRSARKWTMKEVHTLGRLLNYRYWDTKKVVQNLLRKPTVIEKRQKRV